MKVIILGSGGWIPTEYQETMSVLVDDDTQLILLDAGTGISNLSKYPQLISKYDTVNILLSHYHLDHIIGLSYISKWFKNHHVKIYAPEHPYYENDVETILSKFLSTPYFSLPLDKIGADVECVGFSPKFKIGDTEIETIKQMHSSPSFGIKLNHTLCYCTDTIVDQRIFEWAKHSKLLLHECWSYLSTTEKHSSLEEIEAMQKCYKIEQIGLVHKNPDWDCNNYPVSSTSSIFWASDLDEFVI